MTDNEIRNAVIEMAERKESVGLAFLGGGYKLDGVGTCADRIVKIPVKVGFNKVGRIRSGAFGNCDFLEEILIPACVDSVADGAFDGCRNLKRVHILGKDTNFEGNAFINCPSIEDVFFYGNRTEWERFCDWKLELYPRESDDRSFFRVCATRNIRIKSLCGRCTF